MDFFTIQEQYLKSTSSINVYPDFKVGRSKDIMVRGKSFYAIWNQEKGLWSTDEYDVQKIIDKELENYCKEHEASDPYFRNVTIKSMGSYSSNSWKNFKQFLRDVSDSYKPLDNKIIFSNTDVKKEDYASHKLSYPLKKGSIKAYNKIMSTLYSPDEREKIEWAIGAIISGDSKKIQKFLVFYGDPGTGKSTVLEIIQDLFDGYYKIFDAKSLASSNNAFSTEQLRTNPLVGIQHDGDLSKIDDNSVLNSIVSHEEIQIHEKFKSEYSMRTNCFLLMATNKPVKITDAKSGLIRRVIDVRPTGNKIPVDEYFDLMEEVKSELGAIAYHCLDIYESMGKDYYNKYRPVDMMYKTDPFFNFVESNYDIFIRDDGISLKQAYTMYKQYCEETSATYKLQMYIFREELKNYFNNFDDIVRIDGVQVRSYYSGFITKKFERNSEVSKPKKKSSWLDLKEQPSLFDDICKDCKAQLANDKGTPLKKWANNDICLKELDTSKLHYVKVPINHIVIDFDIKDSEGNKSLETNIEAAKRFPKTYAETSQSGGGLHLHYIYDGNPEELSRVYDDNIEIKVYKGDSSLRRKLTICNDIPIAHINSGLPLREVKPMIDFDQLKNEKVLRSMIKKNLRKEIHAATKPSIDFIEVLLNEAYESGMHYDVTDLRQAVMIFAANSTNQSDYCLSRVPKMKFRSEESSDIENDEDGPIIFYDIEVFPNLLLVNWKKEGEGNPMVRMINPTPNEIEELVKHKLVGFNCRRYDNHILWARIMKYTNMQIYKLSSKIVNSKKGEKLDCFFGEAYNLSYTDIYDYSTDKKSLKKWEIELGIHHQELGLPWDQPVPEERWQEVAEYCDNDVYATEAVWNATKADFKARQILVEICRHAGLDASVNDTTNSLTTKIIFGNNKKPELEYTDLSEEFPGYEFIPKTREHDKANMYRGEDVGFGGYVFGIPGVYVNAVLLDITSMHPHSTLAMNCFGEYTDRYRDIVNARIYIKHKEFDKARKMLDGALAPYLDDEEMAGELSKALKIPINSVYGLTSASFPNPFRHPKNDNNIVALRGALFMMTLRDEVIARGYEVIHIKTDSIKIANGDQEIIDFCMDFARKYKYEFEHEATYEKICLVNNSTYIAKYSQDDVNGKHKGEWTATAAQFQQPYVFKTLFSHEPIIFKDLCEIKEVKGALYLDFNENLPDVSDVEKVKELRLKNKDKHNAKEIALLEDYGGYSYEMLDEAISTGHDYRFIGRIGEFCPIKEGCGGGVLLRYADDKYSAAVGTKGYRWMESELVKTLGKEDCIDKSYYTKLVDAAINDISQYTDFEWFIS